jgi:hypothetical protein
VNALAPLNSSHVRSDKTSGNCQLGESESYTVLGDEQVASDPKFTTWLTPVLHTYAGAGPVSETFSFSDSGKSGSGTGHTEGTETISFEGAPAIPGVGPPSKAESKEPPSKGGGGGPATKKIAERRRAELKQQARQDLRPAITEAWGAHGLSGVLGVAGSLGLGAVADDIGGAAAIYEGNDATIRIVNDYRIYKDPASGNFKALAEPAAGSPAVLPSCGTFHGAEAVFCEKLSLDASQLLAQAAAVVAIGAAEVKTIDRDTAAIRAHDYAAAKAQANHFESLRSAMKAALKAQGRAGAAFAADLGTAGVPAVISKARAAAAIKWLKARLAKRGVPTAALRTLAGPALKPVSTTVTRVLSASG